MKIGLIIYGSLDTLSGGYLYDRMLVRELDRQGCRVEILALPQRNYPRHLLDNLDGSLVERIVRARYDLLLQDELNHPSLFYLNTRLRTQISVPIVSIVHHLRSHESHPNMLLPLYRALERRYLRTVDAYLVNSWTTRRAVESLIMSNMTCKSFNEDEGRFHVAYPAADHLHAPPAEMVRGHIEQHVPSPCAASVPLSVAFVGNVIPRKSLHTVVESLAYLRQAQPGREITLHVIGNLAHAPRYVAAIREFIARRGLQNSVVFHGQLSDENLSKILLACQVLAVPSYEGFGIVYLEAMRLGLCPIASTAGAAHEIVRHGENGLLVTPDSPGTLAHYLGRLADSPRQLNQYRRAALDGSLSFFMWEESMSLVYQWLCEIQSRKRQLQHE